MAEVKRQLKAFYRKGEDANVPVLLKAIRTFKNWRVEILTSSIFKYSNGLLDGSIEKTKVSRPNKYIDEFVWLKEFCSLLFVNA